jgi:hypothetical protein
MKSLNGIRKIRTTVFSIEGDPSCTQPFKNPSKTLSAISEPGEKVFVVGCNNCAWKCHSGGEDETEKMADRLTARRRKGVGHTVPGPQGMSLCKLDHTRKVLQEDYADPVAKADSFLVLGCGQGVHTVIDATEGGMVHPGCDTIFGGETVSAETSKSTAPCAASASSNLPADCVP